MTIKIMVTVALDIIWKLNGAIQFDEWETEEIMMRRRKMMMVKK